MAVIVPTVHRTGSSGVELDYTGFPSNSAADTYEIENPNGDIFLLVRNGSGSTVVTIVTDVTVDGLAWPTGTSP